MNQKNKIQSFIDHNKEYEKLILRVKDVIEQVWHLNSFKILYFVNEYQQQIIDACLNHYDNVHVSYHSQIINSEYKLATFYTDIEQVKHLESAILCTFRYNTKFNELSHRDVLGSLMALKIERHHIGDIIVEDGYVYFEIESSLYDYIKTELTSVKKVKVQLNSIDYQITKKYDFIKLNGIVKSYRLDNIVKLITKQSSKETREYILQNNVKINQVNTDNFSKLCRDNDVLSLRGYGRYLLKIDEQRKTKRDNYVIEVLKYQ